MAAEAMHQSAAVKSNTKELDKVYTPTTNNSKATCVFGEVGQAYHPSISKKPVDPCQFTQCSAMINQFID
jgi:hypothetical protein